MADSFPIAARTGVAREPLDPTAIMPGPQPLDVAERTEANLIMGEVLKPGRHRAARPRRKVAISGAVLSAAGAFVTLALMMSHGSGGTVSAAPRVAPSAPLPDLPGGPAAAPHPAHASPAPATPHTAAPVVAHAPVTPHVVTPAVVRPAAQQRWAAAAAAMRAQTRKEAAHSAQAWAAAMRQAPPWGQHAGRQQSTAGPYEQQSAASPYEQQSAEQNRTATARRDNGRGQGPRHARGRGGRDGGQRSRGGVSPA